LPDHSGKKKGKGSNRLCLPNGGTKKKKKTFIRGKKKGGKKKRVAVYLDEGEKEKAEGTSELHFRHSGEGEKERGGLTPAGGFRQGRGKKPISNAENVNYAHLPAMLKGKRGDPLVGLPEKGGFERK